jgi:penicillin V acylase-like amidase (Ntn superfamily)
MTPARRLALLSLIPLTAVAAVVDVKACSRVLWADNGRAVVVGRNMDWFKPMLEELWGLPRGIKRDGMTGKNTLSWRAKYGSVVANVAGPADGMNEKGLAAHMLWLAESEYGPRDESKPGLSMGQWLQFYLDNFATVQEAVEFTEKNAFQVVTLVYDGLRATTHMALEDASGDSAVIEYIDGKPRIYHGRSYTVMTNSPPFDQQVEALKGYKGFGGDRDLPGSSQAADRFVRGAFYLKNLPKPDDERDCVAGVLSIMRNMAQPFGVRDPNHPNTSPTRWRTVCDLTNRAYYFESSLNPNIVWVKLDKLDFAEGAPILKLDLVKNRDDHLGDCSGKFTPSVPFVVPPVEAH